MSPLTLTRTTAQLNFEQGVAIQDHYLDRHFHDSFHRFQYYNKQLLYNFHRHNSEERQYFIKFQGLAKLAYSIAEFYSDYLSLKYYTNIFIPNSTQSILTQVLNLKSYLWVSDCALSMGLLIKLRRFVCTHSTKITVLKSCNSFILKSYWCVLLGKNYIYNVLQSQYPVTN